MNLADLLLSSIPALCLAVGLVLYVRHGHRRLYRELRQLRETAGALARQQAVDEARAQLQALEPRVEAMIQSHVEAMTVRLEAREQTLLEGLGAQERTLVERLDAQHNALGRFEARLGEVQAASAEQAARAEQAEQAERGRADQLAAIGSRLDSRLEALEASGQQRDAHLRAELARHQEVAEQANRDGLGSLQERLEQALRSLHEALGALEHGTHSRLEVLAGLQETLRAAQEAAGREFVQATQASSGLLAELVARPAEPENRALRPLQRLQIDLEFVKNRMSAYLGEGMGLTHLVDETPIYLNTADIGCPANFINGGRYEEEYLQVLASFCRPDTVFLDIGANLGVFSLRLAPYLREGRIIAFEPNARIRDLFGRSVHLNGLRDRIEIHDCGASDESAELVLEVPQGHAGGGHVERAQPGDTRARIQVRPLDEVLHELPAFQVAKIDVEGHELHALRGMRALLSRSPQAVVLFEKLIAYAGLEAPMLALFAEHGMRVWRIEGVRLEPVDLAGFEQGCAYFLAARPETVGQEFDRGFVRIRAGQLFKPQAREEGGRLLPGKGPHAEGALLFHGPYWYLPRGVYRVKVEGALQRPLQIQVAEKFGYGVAQAVLDAATPSFDFIAERDLTHFELVGRATGEDPAFEIESLLVSRIG
ncbi:MAG: FkbM family methyltransferase [Rubrivivax sp.]